MEYSCCQVSFCYIIWSLVNGHAEVAHENRGKVKLKKGIINLVHGGACREIMVPTNPKTAVYNANRQSCVV
ncbi:hypothetical protein EmuJ_000873700 [Echinococcus multilocularis]|uniref:Uncharacterized protein n=1 Tax=Echinococcus multilocularis TaxID=6211 RepID=A0A068YCV4_ECHMU|nr:hypothetical protein EmuJ_000873700 [Echinococcus multilocularis]